LDRLLHGKCPWHKDANHTAWVCRALSNGVIKDDDSKRHHRDRPSGSKITRACPRRRNSVRRDDDDQREDSPGNFQEEDKAVNFIFSGPSKPSCQRKLKLDDREVNLVFKHPVEPLRWSEMPITFDCCDHWVHLPRPGGNPLVVSPVVSQVHLAKVLVDGGSALDIIFASTLESMGYDMTSLVPSDQAFYGIIPRAGSTPVGRATLPVTFGTRDNYRMLTAIISCFDHQLLRNKLSIALCSIHILFDSNKLHKFWMSCACRNSLSKDGRNQRKPRPPGTFRADRPDTSTYMGPIISLEQCDKFIRFQNKADIS
jgi:hypothetical protein